MRIASPCIALESDSALSCFHDQMQVIALDRVVDDAHAEALPRLAQRLFHDPGATVRPKIADARLQSERDVNRIPRGEVRPFQMRYAGSDQPRVRMLARPPGAGTPAAPLRQIKTQVLRHRS